jgi:transcriptional regulator with XRE-family HTH domain
MTLETYMMSDKADITKLVSPRPSGWKAKAATRLKEKGILRDQREVCLIVLEELGDRKMTQAALAALMDVSPQFVNRLLKGDENFTFQTIHKLQDALGIRIMTIERTLPAAFSGRGVEKLATQVKAQMTQDKLVETAVKKLVAASVASSTSCNARHIVEEMQPCMS